MSTPGPRASELAAQQVEQIVGAAQEAADQIRVEASAVREHERRKGERDAEEVRTQARNEAEAELHEARKQAIMLTQDARRDAEGIVSDAKQESEQMREQTRRAVEGRVASAEKAAAEVLAEARALSGGLRQLGRSLEDHADRILHDVQAAHQRMQADLRVGYGGEPEATAAPSARPSSGRAATPSSAARPSPRPAPAREEPAAPPASPPSRRERPNPFEDLEVPSWVARDR